jgi:hypothetical protein
MRGRTGYSAEERLKLFKLAWDIVGDAFGMRAQQYVHFHGGDPIRLTAAGYLDYNKDPFFDIVDRALDGNQSIPISPEHYPDTPASRPSGQTLHAYPAIGVPQRTKPRDEQRATD